MLYECNGICLFKEPALFSLCVVRVQWIMLVHTKNTSCSCFLGSASRTFLCWFMQRTIQSCLCTVVLVVYGKDVGSVKEHAQSCLCVMGVQWKDDGLVYVL